MKREKTKYKGIYKIGEIYYITYYVGSKKFEKAVGPDLSEALKEKLDRETKVRRGRHDILERQEKTTMDQLIDFIRRRETGSAISFNLKGCIGIILERERSGRSTGRTSSNSRTR